MLSVVESARVHPGKMVLLKGVNPELFIGAVYDGAFHVFGVDDLFLVPENRTALAMPPHFAGFDRFFADSAMVNQALEKNLAVVLDVTERNRTRCDCRVFGIGQSRGSLTIS